MGQRYARAYNNSDTDAVTYSFSNDFCESDSIEISPIALQTRSPFSIEENIHRSSSIDQSDSEKLQTSANTSLELVLSYFINQPQNK